MFPMSKKTCRAHQMTAGSSFVSVRAESILATLYGFGGLTENQATVNELLDQKLQDWWKNSKKDMMVIRQILVAIMSRQKSVQDIFVKGVRSLVATVEETGNPFMEDSGNSLNLNYNVTLKLPKSVTLIMCRTSYQPD